MADKVKPDAILNLPRWDAPGDTPSHYVTDDVFTRSTILRVIQQHAEMYGRRALTFDDGESEAALLALLQVRACFEEVDDG